jgi:hypothetical protein
MQHYRHSLAIAILVTVLTAGCGGGGSSTPSDSATIDLPPASAKLAGTYSCADTDAASSLVFTAVLPAATTAFSSCNGSAAALSIAITCTGSVASDGTLRVSGTDSNGNSLSFLGEATATQATGTYSITPANVFGSFLCKH